MSIKYPKIIVDEYTSPIEESLKKTSSLKECHELIKEKGYRHLPISDENGEIVGLLSQRDIALFFDNTDESDSINADVIMKTELYIVDHDTPIEKVVFELSDRKIGSALVRDAEGKVYGIFTTTDAMNALIELLHKHT